MVETRTLVVDVDDTISTHINRDYENAIPHTDIIEKLNKMYDSGWKIIYFTARGQISCNGDLNLIEKSRRPALEKWMKKHNVKHHELRFGKPIGVYYIDDKAIRPDEFMNVEYEVLKGGSGSFVERVGDRIIKKAKNAKDQASWMIKASEICKVPKVNTYYGDTLDMEYIDGESLNSACNTKRFNQLLSYVEEFRNIPTECNDWDTMVDRVKDHISLNAIYNEMPIINLLESDEVCRFMKANASFSHGDLTFENCIVKDDNVYLIDPNNPKNVYSSWILDVGKLYQSLHYHYEETFSDYQLKIDKASFYNEINKYFDKKYLKYFLLCEMIHYIRMLKYKPDYQKGMVRERIQMIFEEVSKCF